jgi:predicted ATPase/DNA-binding CsgD family transcriptional regulator
MEPQPLLEPLTEREAEIISCLVNGLNNKAIADELFLAPSTVKWYIRQLNSKLNTTNRDEIVARATELGLLDFNRPEPVLPKHNLPTQFTTFIGRQREIDEITRLLAHTRLLTLTGTGGTGKTRLGIQVAELVLQHFANGVYFVSLISLTDPALVTTAIADVLDVTEKANEPLAKTLTRAIGDGEILLLLDNFEHVMAAVTVVSRLLEAPNLKVLVTSREILRVSGEQVYIVPPLTLPDLKQQNPAGWLETEAMKLFVQRATTAKAGFRVTEKNIGDIAEICVRLDGVPLALELAAARTRLLSPRAIRQRLDQRFSMLTAGVRDAPPRQQTLHDAIEWSYDLLEIDEQKLFARLSIFHGGCTLEAIEEICGTDMVVDVLDILAALVDKSLVWQVEGVGGEPRFMMLESIHIFAHEKLEEGGNVEDILQLHAVYFAKLAEHAEPQLLQKDQIFWLDRLEEESDNLRAAFEWGILRGEADIPLRLIASLAWFWYLRSYIVEGSRWAARALAMGKVVYPSLRVKALTMTAFRLTEIHEMPLVTLKETLTLAREIGDKKNESLALLAWSLASQFADEISDQEHTVHLNQIVGTLRELDDKPYLALVLTGGAAFIAYYGDRQQAASFLNEGHTLFHELANPWGMALAENNLALLKHLEGENKEAELIVKQGLIMSQRLKNVDMNINLFVCLAAIWLALGKLDQATQMLAAVDAILAVQGTLVQVPERYIYERTIDNLRRKLDITTFDRLWNKGRKMSLEQAVAFGLGDISGTTE